LSSARRALPTTTTSRPLWADVRLRHPRAVEAILADARTTAAYRGERFEFRSTSDGLVQAARLALVTDSFFALCCYRIKARCQTHQLPVLPELFHRLAMMTGQICIGSPVVVRPGVYIPHGQVVVDGITEVGPGVVLSPFVTIGLLADQPKGPNIGRRVRIGTGAKVIGPIEVGDEAVVGANAVVIDDVPAKATVVGAPARVVDKR
jgi:serine O-acetyltransferase